jgi:DNA (cytosine-5)-methyltransferase 1
MQKLTKYRMISMFSGCGGMDLGFLGGFHFLGREYARNPFDIVWANDLNPYACATYKHNLKHEIHVGSVWDHIDSMPPSADLLVGGFPCQDISVNGKRAGVAGARSGLYRAMVDAVEKTKPKIFIAENVKGLLFSYNKESLATVLKDFSALGYDVSYSLYFAPEYGVPQRRERVLIVGVKDGLLNFKRPDPIFSKPNFITSSMAISDLEDHPVDEDFSHIFSLAKKSSDQGSRFLDPNKPAATVRAECHGNNQFHYNQPRRITMREAARFQSFPDSFKFVARLRETERMIGNAVPPVLAWHVAQSVEDALKQMG